MREVFNLAMIILKKVGDDDPIFKDARAMVVGSVKEFTRTFSSDELDIYVSLDNKMKTDFDYNPDKQELVATGDIGQKYLKEGHKFNCYLYFCSYLESIENALQTINLDDGFIDNSGQPHPFTMEPLTSRYQPCLPCMQSVEGRAQARRCRHREDCQPHREGEGECRQGCREGCQVYSHQKTCHCQEYTSPSLTR